MCCNLLEYSYLGIMLGYLMSWNLWKIHLKYNFVNHCQFCHWLHVLVKKYSMSLNLVLNVCLFKTSLIHDFKKFIRMMNEISFFYHCKSVLPPPQKKNCLHVCCTGTSNWACSEKLVTVLIKIVSCDESVWCFSRTNLARITKILHTYLLFYIWSWYINEIKIHI